MITRILAAVKEAVQGKPLSLRSPKWHGVRDAYLRDHSSCAACGGTIKLQVHHKQPFHLHPDLELDPANFITLCETVTKCHLEIGHLGNWKNFNPNVVDDAAKSLTNHVK
jgi:5-methylcytosine-specific restriction enzyme A